MMSRILLSKPRERAIADVGLEGTLDV